MASPCLLQRVVGRAEAAGSTGGNSAVQFIDTSFENASPAWYEPIAEDAVAVHLLYDHERSSPNRAAGHFHFRVEANPGARLTLEFRNLENIWNGKPASIVPELKVAVVSEDGRHWRPVPLQSSAEGRVRLTIVMPGPKLYVARVEPYRLSDLERLLVSLRKKHSAKIEQIGRTVEGRPLEIIHLGAARARHHVFLRARAHPWEAGSSWVAQGLMDRLLAGDPFAKSCLERYSVSILPMANKDGVARGRTRFNLRGQDLNRGWDRPADPELSPENSALEKWLERQMTAKRKPDLALELHNDGSGLLHISRPQVPGLQGYVERMARLESLLRQHTWFTEGTTSGDFRNSGTLGDGWLERYGIDAVVHELNCNWIAGLKDYPSARHWQSYGAALAKVFYEYFAP